MPTDHIFPYGGNAALTGKRIPMDGIWMQETSRDDGKDALLDAHAFAGVVAAVPLISIDLIAEDERGEVLLGLRRNPPARDCWFVPGGRIRKGETLDAAFARICCDELGQAFTRQQARFLDVFEHFYDTNFRGTAGATTHYVVHAYRLRVQRDALRLPAQQHSHYAWIAPADAAQRMDVHPYTRAYFKQTPLQD
jgi:colanic acid biosynthesis protein WcaH